MLNRTLLLSISLASAAWVTPAAANDLPYNPYSGPRLQGRPQETPRQQRPTQRFGLRSAPRWQQLDPLEYPQGEHGPRHVHVTIGASERAELIRQFQERADGHDRHFAKALEEHDRAIRRTTERVAALDKVKHVTRADFKTWLDYREYLRQLYADREEIRKLRIEWTKYYQSITRYVRSARETRVIWNVRNHKNRTYVPRYYLRDKAIGYLLKHPDQIGKTTRLNF